ncbi:sensor histidine kinase [Paenibacillus sp. HB172176]|uniref:cache domain-containing sensor histidine kinase n=1 Tax=Paenibacillus sp. HB172176 TaxID=2493690 RepID=UPI00143AB755|nr:sensor histidine kinase [Paenibacillus sp. HB172176]
MTKLLVLTGLLLFLSVFFESYLSYTRYTRDFQQQSSDKVQQIIDQVSINIDTYLDDLYRLTLSPYRNSGIMTALEEPSGGTELQQLEKRRLVENFLDEMMIYPRKDILRVSIVTDQIYSSARLPTRLVPDENLAEYDWYKQALASQEYIFVPSRNNEFNNDNGNSVSGNVQVFSVVKQLRSISNTQHILGVIKADANYKGIVDIVEKAEMGSGGGLFIIDEHQDFIYASNEEQKELALTALADESSVDDDYLLNTSFIPRTNWQIVAVNSVTEMNREAIHTRNQTLAVSLASALISILALVLLIRHFLKPLLAIVRLMKEVELGRLNVTFQSKRRDEIGYLGTTFNRLVSRISGMLQENTKLVEEVYESKLLQQEAQIHALFSQIQPHFIFNTLNLISLSMQSGMQDKAIQHINGLSSILRGMSQWDKEIPLSKEIELLQAYLGIQSSRYEGRLSYSIAVAPELLDYRVPALLLQPLVENAVIHGCEAQKETTSIAISSTLLSGLLRFEVRDNGPGMDEETLRRLQSRLDGLENAPGEEGAQENTDDAAPRGGKSDGRHAGIGLLNVNRRIKVRYGEEYGLTIHSKQGEGTLIILSIPYHAAKET